jgi:hypothetical protein
MSKQRRFPLTPSTLLTASAVLSLALAGCGGGGGGDATTAAKPSSTEQTCPTTNVSRVPPFANANPEGTPVNSLSPDDYLIAQQTGFAPIPLAKYIIVLADPQNPQSEATEIKVSGNMAAPRSRTQSTTSATLGPAPFVYFVNAGHVYKADLKRGNSQLPVQLSTLGNGNGEAEACSIMSALPIEANASSSALVVATVAAGADCISSPSTLMLVHSDLNNKAKAKQLPAGVNLPATGLALLDKAGKVIGVPAMEAAVGGGTQLAVYSPIDFSRLYTVANGQGVSDVGLLSGDAQNTSGLYLKVQDGTPNGTLRYLSWGDNQASLSQCLYAFNQSAPLSVADTDATFVLDGTTLVKATGGTNTDKLATLPDATLASDGLFLSTNHLVVHQSASLASGQIVSVSKASGEVKPLVAKDTAGAATIIGGQGDTVVYAEDQTSGLQNIFRLSVKDGGKSPIASNALLVSGIWQRDIYSGAAWDPVAKPSAAPLNALIYCTPKDGEGSCVNGSFMHYSISAGLATSLGTSTSSASGSAVFSSDNFGLYDGLNGSLTAFSIGIFPDSQGGVTKAATFESYLVLTRPTPAVPDFSFVKP